MKTPISSRSGRRGSILIIALLSTTIIAMMLAGYLVMTASQYRTTLRSQAWNSIIPTVEAGVEEALTHMNRNCLSNTVINQPVNFTADGWQQVTPAIYSKRGDLSDSYYIVTIDFTVPNDPIIEAEGFVIPTLTWNTSGPQFAQIGNTANTQTTQNSQTSARPIARKVRVKTGRDNMIAKAMFAKGQIDISGNNVQSDSFDSTDPAYSINGQYDATRNKDNGDIASNAGLVNSLNVGNATVLGTVSTGPGGTVSIGPNGSVGDLAWVNSGTQGIQPGHSTDDMNVYVPEVVLPFSGGLSSALRFVTLTNEEVHWLFQTNSYATYNGAQQAATQQGGAIVTNTAIISTNLTHPAAGTYLGAVLVNTRWVTNASYPVSGTYIGGVTTNVSSQSSTTYPSTFIGTVATNTVNQTTVSYPASGTYVGTVTTNVNHMSNQRNLPPAGGYVPGTEHQRPNGKWDYDQITGYTYQKIVSYFYQTIRDYSCSLIIGYTYNLITDYGLVGKQATTNLVVKTFDYVFDTGDYEVSNLGGKVLVRGNARVHVTANASFTGQDAIEINYSANLKLYVSAASASIKGQGVLNYSGTANQFYYYGLPSNTDISIGGNGGFTGVIYAPQAHFHLGGGGNNTQDFVGASITKSVKMNGHFHFHYDESLAGSGPARGFVITSWDEIQ